MASWGAAGPGLGCGRRPGPVLAAGGDHGRAIGLVLGAAAGTGTTSRLLPWYHASQAPPTPENANQQLGLALATHGGIWMAVGAAAGLALGLGLGGGRVAQAILGGILGAAVAAVINEFAGAIAFPMDKTFLPTGMAPAPRLLAHLAVALCVSAGTFWAADHLSLRRRVRSRTHLICDRSSSKQRPRFSPAAVEPGAPP